MKRGSKMSDESKKKLSIARRGNKNRLGVPHSDAMKAQISASLKRAYAEGRHRRCANPENLKAHLDQVKSGAKPHPSRNPERDARIAASYLKHRDAHKAGAEHGISYSAVYYALERAGVLPIRKGG